MKWHFTNLISEAAQKELWRIPSARGNGLWPAPQSGVNSEKKRLNWQHSHICAAFDSTVEWRDARVRVVFTAITRPLGHDSVKRADEGETADRDEGVFWVMTAVRAASQQGGAPHRCRYFPPGKAAETLPIEWGWPGSHLPAESSWYTATPGLFQHTHTLSQTHWKDLKWLNANFEGRRANLVFVQTVNIDQQGGTRAGRNTGVNVSGK